ncbi:MAG: hypothetical protein ACHQSE_06870 [Gemmatimonadales bacterium]
MRLTRIAALLAGVVVPMALAAQQAARPDAPRPEALEAEVHYATGGDAWFSTNKAAYVALFDVSRGGVTQLYPTFSAQATELSGTSVRVEMRSAAALPGAGPFSGSSLVALNTPVGGASAAGWPHTLLLVASTQPLRIGSSWASNIAINNDLVRNHQWNDLDTDAGIAAVVDLVRPLDWGAEVATDRVPLATPARYASSLAYDPNRVAVGYSCMDADRQFISPVPQLGAYCVALREFPARTGTVNASTVAATAGGTADSTRRVVLQAHGAATGPAAPRISEQKHGDVQSISDPNDIRKFMESMKARQATHGAADGAMESRSGPRDGTPASERSGAGANGRNAEGSPASGGSAGGASRINQGREARPRIEQQAKPQRPADAPSGSRAETARPSASAAPIKPQNERD